MSKQYLIRRLSWYGPTERFNAYFFGALAIYIAFTHPLREILFLLYGLALMVYILFQGQKYWKLKLCRLTKKPYDQILSLSFFQKSERANLCLIGLMPVIWLFQTATLGWRLDASAIRIGALAANGFAILEHINYYHRQLSVDNAPDVDYIRRNKRPKVAQLARDLAEGKI